MVAGPSFAGKYEPTALPQIGGVAPAFGLEAFRAKGEDDSGREVIQLDHYCGVRPGETSMVLLAFVNNESASDDLGPLVQWHRRYNRDGLVVIAISTEKDPTPMGELVAKSRRSFPIVDDQFGIVSQRYGISGAPFTLLLDDQCSVLGMSDKAVSEDSARLQSAIDERVKSIRIAARK